MHDEDKLNQGTEPATGDCTREDAFLSSTPWIIDVHIQDPDALAGVLSKESARFQELVHRPRFSLIAVLRDTLPRHLTELILSVRCQSYQDWELVLVDDGSAPRHHLEIAREWASLDSRIAVKQLADRCPAKRRTWRLKSRPATT